jgi:hypothetical protein
MIPKGTQRFLLEASRKLNVGQAHVIDLSFIIHINFIFRDFYILSKTFV